MIYFIYVLEDGVPKTGLIPTWKNLSKVRDNTLISQPDISEVGFGMYSFIFEPNEDIIGVIDTTVPSDRYIKVHLSANDLISSDGCFYI